MAVALPFMAMAAMGVSAAGSLFSGYSQAANSDANAKIANYNAAQARQASDQALRESSANEDAQRRKSAGEMSRQTAALAESGMGLDSGTAVDLTGQSSLNAELDALNIRYAGQLKSNAYQTQAVGFDNEAAMDRANAKQQRIGAWFNAASSALGQYGSYARGQAGAVRAGSQTGLG